MSEPEPTPVYDEVVADTLIDPEKLAAEWAELLKPDAA
jgi:hypothetical protein